MDEVEYCIIRKNSKLAADEVMKLPKGTIPTEVHMCLRTGAEETALNITPYSAHHDS